VTASHRHSSGAAASHRHGSGASTTGDLTAARRAAWKRDLGAALPGWVVARVLVATAYALAVAATNELTGERTTELSRGLMAWDGSFYEDITRVGYGGLPEEALRFFPLFPLLGKGLSFVLLGKEAPALVLLANVAALFAAAAIHRLTLAETGDAATARRAAWLVALLPPAFVLVWGYAEALFLLTTIGCLYCLRSKRWWWAAALGAAAALCRPLGLILVAPAAIEVVGGLRPWGRVWFDRLREHGVAGLAAVLGPVAGCGAYLTYVWWRFGDAFLPFTVQGGFRGDATDPLSRLAEGVGELASTDTFGDGLHLPFAVGLVVLLVLCGRRLPGSFTVYSGLIVFVTLSAENLNSLERYGLNAFPLVVALAVYTADERVDRAVLTVSAAGLVGLATLAWLGAYVP
jgi:hypothetical protein